jgi:hypothetical protein
MLTGAGIWFFNAAEKARWFDGATRWLPTEDLEAEATTLDGDHLIISDGEGDGDLYDVPISSLVEVKNSEVASKWWTENRALMQPENHQRKR